MNNLDHNRNCAFLNIALHINQLFDPSGVKSNTSYSSYVVTTHMWHLKIINTFSFCYLSCKITPLKTIHFFIHFYLPRHGFSHLVSAYKWRLYHQSITLPVAKYAIFKMLKSCLLHASPYSCSRPVRPTGRELFVNGGSCPTARHIPDGHVFYFFSLFYPLIRR